MCKKILIILTLSLAGIAVAQVQGKAALEFGYIPESASGINYLQESPPGYTYINASQVFYTTIDVTAPILKYFFVEGAMDCYFGAMVAGGTVFPIYGSPIVTGYKIGGGFVYGPVSVGIEHECSHPDVPDGTQLLYGDTEYTKCYIKYEVKF